MTKYQYICEIQDYLINLNVTFIMISAALMGNEFIEDKKNLIIIIVLIPSLLITII